MAIDVQGRQGRNVSTGRCALQSQPCLTCLYVWLIVCGAAVSMVADKGEIARGVHGSKYESLLTGERAQEQASAGPEQGASTPDGNGALYAETRTAQVRNRLVDESTEDRAPFHRWACWLRQLSEPLLTGFSARSSPACCYMTGSSRRQPRMGEQRMRRQRCGGWRLTACSRALWHTMH